MDWRNVRGVNLALMESSPETFSSSDEDPTPMLSGGTGVGFGAGVGGTGGGTGIGTGAGGPVGIGAGGPVGDAGGFRRKRLRMELGSVLLLLLLFDLGVPTLETDMVGGGGAAGGAMEG